MRRDRKGSRSSKPTLTGFGRKAPGFRRGIRGSGVRRGSPDPDGGSDRRSPAFTVRPGFTRIRALRAHKEGDLRSGTRAGSGDPRTTKSEVALLAEKFVRLGKIVERSPRAGWSQTCLCRHPISDHPAMSTEEPKTQSQDLEHNHNQADCQAVGLVANGSAGSWEIAVDETISAAAKWFAQIEGPRVYIYFEIPSPQIIDQTIGFIERHRDADQPRPPGSATQSRSLRLGSFGRSPVALVWDDEDRNRCFFVIGRTVQPTIRLTFLDGDLDEFTQALRQVREDLQGEGLL
jgi:hypothetical protein